MSESRPRAKPLVEKEKPATGEGEAIERAPITPAPRHRPPSLARPSRGGTHGNLSSILGRIHYLDRVKLGRMLQLLE